MRLLSKTLIKGDPFEIVGEDMSAVVAESSGGFEASHHDLRRTGRRKFPMRTAEAKIHIFTAAYRCCCYRFLQRYRSPRWRAHHAFKAATLR